MNRRFLTPLALRSVLGASLLAAGLGTTVACYDSDPSLGEPAMLPEEQPDPPVQNPASTTVPAPDPPTDPAPVVTDAGADGSDASADAGPPPPATVTIFGKVWAAKGDRVYTPSAGEGDPSYVLDGTSYSFLKQEIPNVTRPLYRCRNATAIHSFSLSPTCDGLVLEGTLGHVYKERGDRTDLVPIFNCNYSTDHLLSKSDVVCQKAGYAVLGLVGYVVK